MGQYFFIRYPKHILDHFSELIIQFCSVKKKKKVRIVKVPPDSEREIDTKMQHVRMWSVQIETPHASCDMSVQPETQEDEKFWQNNPKALGAPPPTKYGEFHLFRE